MFVNKHIYVHTAVPSPYRKHLFQLIDKAFAQATFFFHERDIDHRPWAYDWADWGVDARDGVAGRFPVANRNWSISRSILSVLWHSERDSVHLVWMGAPFWDIILFALFGLLTRRQIILWNDGAFKEDLSARAKRRYKVLSRWCLTGAFTAGKIGAEYFKELHFREDQIVNSFFSHDADEYVQFYDAHYQEARNAVREQLGIAAGDIVLLNISRFLPLKRLVDLADSLVKIENDAPDLAAKMHVVLIGEGDCKDHERTLLQLKWVRVHGIPQMPPSKILQYYCASDMFVFTSEKDVWGLVVNEALSMGIPVVCTDCIGVSELVRDGENGYLVPARCPDKVAAAVLKLVRDETMLKKCKENARRIVATWNSHLGVDALCKFVRKHAGA